MFWPISADQLQCPTDEAFGISETLFGFGDGRSEIFAARRNSEWTDFCELLSISLYVFSDDRQGCGNRVVHGVSLVRRGAKSSLPRWRCCRYRGHLCIR